MQPQNPVALVPKTKFRHRIPKSMRQNWKLVAVFVAFVTVLATVFGSTRITQQITGDVTVIASEITDNITGSVDLFDTSVTHEVSLEITDAEYHDMIDTFQKTGDKKWVTADITIDGVFVNDVSVRLKGNSTLSGVRGTLGGAGERGFQPPEGLELPEGIQVPDGVELPEAGMGGPGGMSQASEDDPTSLPLLISFDKNYDGRAYQGMTEISIRPGTPVVNEAMALALTAATGQPTQRYNYAVYSVNGATTTRLVLEHPDDTYANGLFDSDGYLYKADANSSFTYVSDDQSDYSDQFKQINAADRGNLQPLINFLKWLDSASDEEFDEHLADWVDIASFSKYLATQNLLVNADDMSGPGQNYYLWYELGTEKISIVSWDLNLAMQGNATSGPHDSVQLSMGGGRGGVGFTTEGMAASEGTTPPGGITPPAGMTAREGMTAPEGMVENSGGPGGGEGAEGGMGGFGKTNALKSRFLESEAFTDDYDNAYWELFEQMYGNGTASSILDHLEDTIPVTDGLTAEALQTSIDDMRTFIGERTATLQTIRSE